MRSGFPQPRRAQQNTSSRRPVPQRAEYLLLAAFLALSLACNLPVFAARTAPGAPDPQRAVRETLAARLFATPLPTAAALPPLPIVSPLPGTPFPDSPLPIVPPPTAMPETQVVTPGLPISTLEGNTFRYLTQPGDTLAALALRYVVPVEQILDPSLYPPEKLLPAGLSLAIPNAAGETRFSDPLLPDSEIVNSPAAADFSIQDYIQAAGGFLNSYTEQLEDGPYSGAQVIQRVADETSTNPRLLLAFLEYRSNWVRARPDAAEVNRFPIGFYANEYSGLYKEITLVARQLTIGYYGWRTGKVQYLAFPGQQQRINPTVNAGTAAVQYLFSTLYSPAEWQAELYERRSFLALYQEMFGDPWQRAAATGVLLPDSLAQPSLELPFLAGERWSFTGGPHAAWGVGSTWGGLDFAPSTSERGCMVSNSWATAAAPGIVLRSEHGQVIVDLDGDGREQTGWVLLYLHVAAKDRVQPGTVLNTNDRVGHPSCEGGFSTGTHVHLARKYNGEWIGADGPLPFVLSGWQVVYGARPYAGTLVKGDQTVTAQPDGSHTSLITR